MLCDYICHRSMIGIALLFEALARQCIGLIVRCAPMKRKSIFSPHRIRLCHFSAFRRRLSPCWSIERNKEIKTEKTWHMTDKDTHHQQRRRRQQQRQRDLFIFGLLVMVEEITAIHDESTMVFSLLKYYCVEILAKVVFAFFFFLRPIVDWAARLTTKQKERKKKSRPSIMSKQWLLFIGCISYSTMTLTPPPTSQLRIVANALPIASEKYPFGRRSSFLNRQITKLSHIEDWSAITTNESSTKELKPWARHWDDCRNFDSSTFLCTHSEPIREEERRRELWNGATVAECWNLSSKHRKDANDVTFEAKRRNVEKRTNDNDRARCVFRRRTCNTTINRTKNKRVTSFMA